MNLKLEAIIFDMDGLMLDTERLAIPSLKVAGKAIGENLTDDIIIEMIGLNENDSNIFLEKKLGKSINREKFAQAFYKDYSLAIEKNGVPIKEGLIDLINFLKEFHIRLAVATSTKTHLAIEKLKLAKILDYFEVIIGGDQVSYGKPAPDIYLKAAKKLGINPKNCIALEDSENGARSAYAAGISVIIVPDIKQPSARINNIALRVCDSLYEVKELISHTLTYSHSNFLEI